MSFLRWISKGYRGKVLAVVSITGCAALLGALVLSCGSQPPPSVGKSVRTPPTTVQQPTPTQKAPDLQLAARKKQAATATANAQKEQRPAPIDVGAKSVPVSLPADFMKSVKAYGAKGDGVSDDTAAIQAAFNDQRVDGAGQPLYTPEDSYYGRPKAVYFPAGTYLVKNTVRWVGCCLTMQGQGMGVTTIRLQDGASGFQDFNNPKPVIQTPKGNMSFRQNIFDLTVYTGSNNPGALGIDYIGNNSSAIRNVSIVSGDGQGHTGLYMGRDWPGPCLIKNVSVTGFNYGIYVLAGEYGPTYEYITLTNQRSAGVYDKYGSLVFRGLKSVNRVPALVGVHDVGMFIVLDSQLSGGAAGTSAIDSVGQIYARNVSSDGYQAAIKYKGSVLPGSYVGEYASNVYQLFDGPKTSLHLPIRETPEFTDPDLTHWARVGSKWYGNNMVQEAMNTGKSTVYFAFGTYLQFDELVVKVPAWVKRIVGFSSVINSDARGVNGGGIRFIVEGGSEPLIIEQFGYGVHIENRSPRPLVIKHGAYGYTDGPGAGDLYLEDVIIAPLVLNHTRNVWARQLNSESLGKPFIKIQNNSANLWILGLKTEGKDTVIRATNGTKTELFGTIIYPVEVFSEDDKARPAFSSVDASMSLVYRAVAFAPERSYAIQIEETRNGVTKRFMTGQIPANVTLFAGHSQ